MTDTTAAPAAKTTPAKKPMTLLEKRQQATINALLKRRRQANAFIKTATSKYQEKIAPYLSELTNVDAALEAQGYDLGAYPDESCEGGCDEPVVGHDVEGVPLCQACVTTMQEEEKARAIAAGEGMIDKSDGASAETDDETMRKAYLRA